MGNVTIDGRAARNRFHVMTPPRGVLTGISAPVNAADGVFVARALRAARLGAGLLVSLGVLVLGGWTFDIGILKGVHPSLVTMKANAAILFLLLGCGLWLARTRVTRSAQVVALVIVFIATLSLAEYAFGVDLHIDQLLFREASGAEQTSHPGRMSPAAAVNFILLGIGVLFLDRRSRPRTSGVAIGLAALISFLSVCGYVYGATSLYRIGPYTSIAIHTTIGFMIACGALVAARPHDGVMSAIVSRTSGGAAIRFLVPAIVLVPLVLGWLRLQGQAAGLYDTRYGVAILTTVSVSLLALTAVRFGLSLHRSDLQRIDAEAESASVRRELMITLNSIGDAVIATDVDGRVVRMNPVAETLTGWSAAEAVGKPITEVFRVVAEGSRATVESPVDRVLRDRQLVELPDRKLLLARDGSERAVADSAAPILDEHRSMRGVALVFRDVTAELANQTALRANEELYRDLFENAPDMWVTADAVTRTILLCNETLAARIGYAKSEIIGRTIDELYTPVSQKTLAEQLDRFMRDGELRDVDRELRCKDGSVVEVSLTLTAIRDAAGQIVQARAIFHEIGERKQAERDQQFLLDLSDLAGTTDDADALLQVVCTLLGNYLDVTRCFVMELDYDRRMAVTRLEFVRGVAPTTGAYPLSAFSVETRSSLEAGRVVVNSNVHTDPRTAAHSEAYRAAGIGATIAVPLMRDGRWVSILGVGTVAPRQWAAREITLVRSAAERGWLWVEKRRVEESLRASEADLHALNAGLETRVVSRTNALSASLREREVLLQEVHHRVKNNLQVISSLINMQMRQLSDPVAEAALAECRARIETIALIHAQLYQTKDYARVPFSEYARSLASNILYATGVSPSSINLELDIESLTLPVDQAIPCGLILNELMTNALKHGFKGNRSGTLRVTMRPRGGTEMTLSVSDDGVGLPHDFSLEHLTSLGMELVSTLVEQLGGTLEIIRGTGTAFVIVFPMEDPL